MALTLSPWQAYLLSLVVAISVAAVDYVTGTEIRIFPLYYAPLMIAAWLLGRRGALFMAAVMTSLWSYVLYLSGGEHSHWFIWPLNLATQGTAFAVLALLVAGLRQSLKRERELSRTDPLTRLPNTRAFYEKGESLAALCRRTNGPLTVGYIDLDHFKTVNDTHGHLKGDAVLRAVARVLQENLRKSDVIARLGGDEFAVLLPLTAAEEARAALEKIRQRIADELQIEGVTVTIGAASRSVIPPSLDGMLTAADRVMYEAKALGKNRVLVKSA